MFINAIRITASVTIRAFGSMRVLAQEIVHAIAGSISSIDPATKLFTLRLPDLTCESFQLKTEPATQISFDKTLRKESVTAYRVTQRKYKCDCGHSMMSVRSGNARKRG
jgi:hypothetical protein